jgi:cyanophycin synthetase
MLDMLMPPGRATHIPLFSVSGSSGRSTTVRLLASALARDSRRCGLTCQDGLFIGENRLKKGDMTGPENVAVVLQDPTIDCAVLETPVDGILDMGLGYELADFGIVLDVAADRPLADYRVYIEDLEDLAYAQSVVVEQVREEGYAILNADEELVLQMRERIDCALALISCRDDNDALREHLEQRGLAVFVERGWIVIQVREIRVELVSLDELGLPAMADDGEKICPPILAAVAALYCYGMSVETIAEALRHL